VTDLALTPHGEEEAVASGRLIRRLLAGRSIDAVFVSPRLRARQTATLALPDEAPIEEPLLVEFAYGEYEGLTSAEIRERRPGWSIWEDGCPGGESPSDAAARAREFLDHRLAGSGLAVAVTHGHMSGFLVTAALGLEPAQGALFASSTGAVSLIRRADDGAAMELWNASPELAND
jgi:probable phosphoglycerate mutase